jgi:hypothetical protein
MNSLFSDHRFGFLPQPDSWVFAGVRIEPIEDHSTRTVAIQKHVNQDGYLYPPLVSVYSHPQEMSSDRKVHGTTRPAQTFQLPASHAMEVKDAVNAEPLYSDHTFLLQALAFINGTRLQFEQWRLDGRIPLKSTLGAWVPHTVQCHFLAHIHSWWRKLDTDLRKRAINLFYAFNRATSAEWDWDMFYQQYIVLDGIYRLHTKIAGTETDTSHKKRISDLCRAYQVPQDSTRVKAITDARNEFFHEAMWAGAMMGYATVDRESFQLPRNLQRLNSRLLCAITGYRNLFTSSVWWEMGSFQFNKPAA